MKILVIDDDYDVIKSLADTLEGIKVLGAGTISQAREILEQEEDIDAALIDVMLGQEDGLTLLKAIRQADRHFPCVMMSGYSTIQTAVESIRLGAWDYLEKPLSLQKVRITLEHIREKRLLSTMADKELSRYRLIGKSPAMQEVNQLIQKASASDLPVLIYGPSGSGKEHVAHLIHLQSTRASAPLIKLNCASIPRDLFESELFGSDKGAYTGALKERKGKIEQANRGSLFLDEIGEMPLEQQAKLLRVLEDKIVTRLGSEISRPVDFRLITATNRDLNTAIKDKLFREDLYYRIGVIIIYIPSLRDRKEDIPLLAKTFLEELVRDQGGLEKEFSPESLDFLRDLPLAGNVRELRNLVQRAFVFSTENIIGTAEVKKISSSPMQEVDNIFTSTMPFSQAKHLLEKKYITEQLKLHQGNISHTAQSLGILPNNLMRRMKILEIR